jgi:hypothetical protein
MYPGNMMLVKNVTDEQGRNSTVLDRLPGNFWTPYATTEDIANRTILQRMWANSRIIYKMDKAYAGETCFPTHIYPHKGITTLFTQVPDQTIINAARNMTHPGMHMRKIFWPVG